MFLFLFSQVRILAPHNTCVFVCFFLQPHNAQNCFRSAASAPLTNNTLPVACSKFPTALFVLIIYVSLYSQNIFTSQLLCRLVLFFLINLIKVDKTFFLIFIFTLFYFTVLYWFCQTLTWIHHGCTCVPKHEPPSHLSPHNIPLGHPSVPAPSICLILLF